MLLFLKIPPLDPDPGGKMNADPCRSGSTTLFITVHFFFPQTSFPPPPLRAYGGRLLHSLSRWVRTKKRPFSWITLDPDPNNVKLYHPDQLTHGTGTFVAT